MNTECGKASRERAYILGISESCLSYIISLFLKTFPICSFEQANLHGNMYIAVNFEPLELVRPHTLSFDTLIAFFSL